MSSKDLTTGPVVTQEDMTKLFKQPVLPPRHEPARSTANPYEPSKADRIRQHIETMPREFQEDLHKRMQRQFDRMTEDAILGRPPRSGHTQSSMDREIQELATRLKVTVEYHVDTDEILARVSAQRYRFPNRQSVLIFLQGMLAQMTR